MPPPAAPSERVFPNQFPQKHSSVPQWDTERQLLASVPNSITYVSVKKDLNIDLKPAGRELNGQRSDETLPEVMSYDYP